MSKEMPGDEGPIPFDIFAANLPENVPACDPGTGAITQGNHDNVETLKRIRAHLPKSFDPKNIAMAGPNGLIVALGHRVFDRALATVRSRIAAGLDPGSGAVKVAAMQPRQDDFAAPAPIRTGLRAARP